MKIGILTSSRADYGIYLPLLNKLKSDKTFDLEIIAFGTHLSKSHGYTVRDIEEHHFAIIHKISSLVSNDDEQALATSYGLTVLKFAEFWHFNSYDLVFCIGDRFEMSAAVQAGIPFNIKFAHIHGGETTLGSIDNIFRHQLTITSKLHFTSSNEFSERVSQILGSSFGVFTVGSLSLDGINDFIPIAKEVFVKRYNITSEEFALVTFHPETIRCDLNAFFAVEMRIALEVLSEEIFLVVTMPNNDTFGSIFRSEIENLKKNIPNRVQIIENFGKENYFNAMYHSSVLIGNTSSGILEAASFNKFVVNVGERQKGRLQSVNVFNCDFDRNLIISSVRECLKLRVYEGENIYYKMNVAENIIKIVKESV